MGLDDVKVDGGVLSLLSCETLLRSTDGGASWMSTTVQGAANLNAAQLLTAVAALQ